MVAAQHQVRLRSSPDQPDVVERLVDVVEGRRTEGVWVVGKHARRHRIPVRPGNPSFVEQPIRGADAIPKQPEWGGGLLVDVGGEQTVEPGNDDGVDLPGDRVDVDLEPAPRCDGRGRRDPFVEHADDPWRHCPVQRVGEAGGGLVIDLGGFAVARFCVVAGAAHRVAARATNGGSASASHETAIPFPTPIESGLHGR